ncbi:MAG: hypothetical protein QOI73_3686 [Solirubrobacteraceae bacterium]|nr:hypothetical protein [Solirubrobacteraceae bacterium]
MLHRNAIATIITTALAITPAAALAQTPGGPAGPPAPPPPPPPIGIPAPPPPPPPAVLAPAPVVVADATHMANYVQTMLNHNAAGWQLAIAQNGKLAIARADGTARTKIDNDGVRLKMKPTMRYELASLTKNFTALSTMKLLRLRGGGMSIDSPITTYLPPDWKPSAGIKTVTFRQLLTHSSGIKQAIAPLSDEKVKQLGLSGSYNGLREIVKLKVVPTPGVAYSNQNYQLLRVLNARMWKASGAKLHDDKGNVLAVKAGTDWRYALDFLNSQVLHPSGIATAGCDRPASSKTALNYYRPNVAQADKGAIAYWPANQCAGNAGLRLSSVEVVRYLAHLRHGKIVEPEDLARMDALHLGWDKGSTTSVFRHGGDITISGVQVHTCGITFPDGTEAALIVNSPLGGGIPYQCNLLSNAWKNARP